MNIGKEKIIVDAKGERVEPYKLSPAELSEIMALMRRDLPNSIPDDAIHTMPPLLPAPVTPLNIPRKLYLS